LGDCFLEQCFETYRGVGNVWAAFFRGTSFVLILTNMVKATFWATFSQTHLVTLTVANTG
jgi:hypothetical protein